MSKKVINYPIPKMLSEPITTEEKKKRSKYGNRKVLIDGIWFDSQKEGDRYLYLKKLEKAGLISDLRLQVKFELQPSFKINGKTIRSVNYIADFVYKENKKKIIEDVKASESFQTDIYKLKKKLFMYIYNTEIKEIY